MAIFYLLMVYSFLITFQGRRLFSYAFYQPSKLSLFLAKKMYLSEKSIEDNQIAKLPIIQVFGSDGLKTEFICGNDIDIELKKFSSYISAFSRELNTDTSYLPKIEYIKWPIDNIYSDDKLESVIRSQEMSVVELYRSGCKKCQVVVYFSFVLLTATVTDTFRILFQKTDEFFEKFAKLPTMQKIHWFKCNVEHVPVYTQKLKRMLAGYSEDSKELDNVTSRIKISIIVNFFK